MQIQGSSLMASSLAAPQARPLPRGDAAVGATMPPAASKDPGAGGNGVTFRDTEAPMVSIATIMQHWGTSNAEADLNTDGIVDAQDLAIALNAGTDPVNIVQQNWGQNGQNAANGGDYNGDGVVNAMDLAMALNGGNEPRSLAMPETNPEPTAEEVVRDLVEQTFAARDADGDGNLVAGDFADSGRLFERLDIDQNGGVGREELAKALFSELERVREYFPDVKPDAFAQRWLDTLTTGRPVIDIGQFRRVQQAFSKPTTPQLASQILSARA
ncbi:MAG: hypothetical protein RLZZ238_1476 [Planctomycetota bacterium]|jgi:Ca2+-binding EF-hand superfamily protein